MTQDNDNVSSYLLEPTRSYDEAIKQIAEARRQRIAIARKSMSQTPNGRAILYQQDMVNALFPHLCPKP